MALIEIRESPATLRCLVSLLALTHAQHAASLELSGATLNSASLELSGAALDRSDIEGLTFRLDYISDRRHLLLFTARG